MEKQSRGNVLNRRGEFNRCTITRLVLAKKWEEETWKKAWESREDDSGDEEISLITSNKSSTKCRAPKENAKRRKVEDEEGHVWGEPLGEEDVAREEFLRGEKESKPIKPSLQSKLVVLLSGVVGSSDCERSGSFCGDFRTETRRDG